MKIQSDKVIVHVSLFTLASFSFYCQCTYVRIKIVVKPFKWCWSNVQAAKWLIIVQGLTCSQACFTYCMAVSTLLFFAISLAVARDGARLFELSQYSSRSLNYFYVSIFKRSWTGCYSNYYWCFYISSWQNGNPLYKLTSFLFFFSSFLVEEQPDSSMYIPCVFFFVFPS